MAIQVDVVSCLEDNYAYIVRVGDAVAVVDPSEGAPVLEALDGRLDAIWCTHHHFDHVGGVDALLAAFPRTPVLGSDYDLREQRIPGQTRGLKDGEEVRLGDAVFHALHVPGQTLGAVAYEGEGALFTGDTLFVAGCGRLFEGTPEMMHASLAKLAALDPATRMYCGHEYAAKNLRFAATVMNVTRVVRVPSVPSPLSEELRSNPFLGVDLATFTARRLARDSF